MNATVKKTLKVIAIVVGSIVGLLLLVEWIGSPIARKVVENHSEQWIGREVTMRRLHVNPFIGSVHIKDLRCTDADSEADFVTFSDLYVRMSLPRLLAKNVYLRHIHLTDFDINVRNDGTAFNFSDLPARFKSDDTTYVQEPDTTPSTWKIDLNDIRLRNGHIAYHDQLRQHRWEIEKVNLVVPGLHFGNQQSDAGLSLNLPDNGGNLRLRGAYNMASNMYSLVLDLADIDLSQAEPFVKEKLNIHSFEAWLSGHLTASGSLDNIMAVKVKGNASVHDLNIRDTDKQNVLSLKEVAVGIDEINPGKQTYRLDTVLIDSLHIDFLRAKNYTTLSRLMQVPAAAADTLQDEPVVVVKDEQTVSSASKEPMSVLVRKFLLRQTSVHYTDKTLFSRFSYDIRSISARADNLTLSGDNHIVLNGLLPHGGSFMANWRGGVDLDKDNVRIVAMLRNVQLQDLSPWVEYMFAYPVKGGTLSLTSDNTIRKGVIDATEKIEISDFKLGKKNNRLDAEMKNIPLKAGIDLMTGVNGKINLDVPITGDLSSPKFSLGKIIGRAIGNALLKATAAPFVAIAAAANKDAGDLTQILVDMLQPDFSLDQYKKLDAIADMMNEHEDLTLELYQQFNLQDAIAERGVFNLKRAFYESGQEDMPAGPLTLVDIEKIRSIKDNNRDFLAFAEPLVGKKGNLSKRAVDYYTADSLQTQVLQHAERRNRFVEHYLIDQRGVDKKRVTALTAPQDELQTYKGKSRYEVRGKTE